MATLAYRIYQFQNIKQDLRPTSELERQKIVEILNKSIDTAGYEIIFGNVLTEGNETFVQVQLKKDNFQKSYLINLKNESFVRKYNEQ